MTDMNSSVKAIEWFEPTAPVESSKNQNAFSALWCGMGCRHHGQSFCCPLLFSPGSGYGTFVFVATFKSVALSIIQLSKSFQHEHVCQNHRTFVKQNFLSS